ncbi:polygalacturonase-1 non-catalytic subunit beta-like [Coffea eugenioides]|uniref:polygalacturonase-1 non-catalytic subunit beta-like n=1 Tax=Coffea eugenioides TaxID=49369 RepID=UPI000F6133A4|nr:polygalacturonase-1 non-catalytic subunit beta-like [Coffea eugenioides]
MMMQVGLSGSETDGRLKLAGENPFTAKASLIRRWGTQVTNDLPMPGFFLNKASPLNAVQMATFSKLLADQNSFSTQLPAFCSKANLLCFPDLSPSLEKYGNDVNFVTYSDKNFTNYGTDRPGGVDTFKNYSNDFLPLDSFRRYSRGSLGHNDKFSTYAIDGNLVEQTFDTYGTTATGGAGTFTNYQNLVNVPNLNFTSYSDDASGRNQGFTNYINNGNSGEEDFKSYSKMGNGGENKFTTYTNDSNGILSSFSNYGKSGNGIKDTFTSYGFGGNVPENTFTSYGDGGNAATEIFKSYSDKTNVGADFFKSYAKDSNAAKANFASYGRSVNKGPVQFTSYGEGAKNHHIEFKIYGDNYSFKKYAKNGVTFKTYLNETGGRKVKPNTNNKWVEPGKFFREKMLKSGTVMPMPDIRDKMPKRSFLPRVIAAKLPFSTSKIRELNKIFHARENSGIGRLISDALNECERAPSPGETKRCVGSGEDMIDFATSVLGRNVVVRTTENTRGSGGNILIGSVKGINGGKVTRSVSCHQSLFPYLLYYCHSVPKVRVYEADILDPNTKDKVNRGVAICHVDTSSWSPGYGAFIALGSGPGKIEVCHWIFENDMTWAVAY